MKNKVKLIFGISLIISSLIFLIIIINIYIGKINSENISTESISIKLDKYNLSEVSDKKISWGIGRAKNHVQPDLGNENKLLVEKYEGYTMGSNQSNKIYLTFDEGYEAGYTEEILSVLKEKEVTATFFLTAHYVNTEPELVGKMIDEGHIIGNHTVNHKSMPELSVEELDKEILDLHIAVQEKYGYKMQYLRPPKGECSEKSLMQTEKLGYTTVMWSFAYEDWNEDNQPSSEYAIDKIISNLHNGAIILLHGNSKTNSKILGEVIDQARNMGYVFCSLEEFE